MLCFLINQKLVMMMMMRLNWMKNHSLFYLINSLNSLQTHNLVMQKHHEILRTLSEIETSKDESGIGGANLTKLKEKTAMFKITANAMAKVNNESFFNYSLSLSSRYLKSTYL